MKFLLNIKLFIILSILFLTNIQGLRRRRPNRIPSVSVLNKRNFNITYYLHNHQIWYECNGFFFKRHRDVVSYYNNLRSRRPMNRYKIPKGAEKTGSIDLKGQFTKIAEYSYQEILKANPFSEIIWNRVWDGCDFYCFAANSFNILKIGIVTEINEYRKLHGVEPLTVNSFLSEIARNQSRQSALPIPVLFKKNRNIGYLGTSCRIDHAHLIVKQMYESFLASYNWHGRNYASSASRFVQLVWKSTKTIGVGICVKRFKIYVSLIFSPKGGVGNFYSNVLPITRKHLYIYNLFGRDHEK